VPDPDVYLRACTSLCVLHVSQAEYQLGSSAVYAANAIQGNTLTWYRTRTAPAVPYGATSNITNSTPPSNIFLQQHASVAKRPSFSHFPPTAPYNRDGFPGSDQFQHIRRPSFATSYHDAVKFTGTSRSHKVAATYTEGIDFHNELYGSLGSITRLDITATSHASHGDDTRMGSVCRCVRW
jgi:hypothetical protein